MDELKRLKQEKKRIKEECASASADLDRRIKVLQGLKDLKDSGRREFPSGYRLKYDSRRGDPQFPPHWHLYLCDSTGRTVGDPLRTYCAEDNSEEDVKLEALRVAWSLYDHTQEWIKHHSPAAEESTGRSPKRVWYAAQRSEAPETVFLLRVNSSFLICTVNGNAGLVAFNNLEDAADFLGLPDSGVRLISPEQVCHTWEEACEIARREPRRDGCPIFLWSASGPCKIFSSAEADTPDAAKESARDDDVSGDFWRWRLDGKYRAEICSGDKVLGGLTWHRSYDGEGTFTHWVTEQGADEGWLTVVEERDFSDMSVIELEDHLRWLHRKDKDFRIVCRPTATWKSIADSGPSITLLPR